MKRQILKIEDFCLALDNPRLTDSRTEEEELEKLVYDQKEKLVTLAEDIILHGLNPLDIIAVYPSSINEGKYVVAEGNRRVAAVKILNNPELIRNFIPLIYNKFKKLNVGFNKISKVECAVFENENDLFLMHWIGIKHLGENQGRGTAKWDSTQKERYTKKVDGESKLLDFWALLENENILSANQIFEITKTNWERILCAYGLKFLNLTLCNNKIILPSNIDDFKLKMNKVHEMLKNETVGIVYDQERIKIFFDKVSKSLYNVPYSIQKSELNLNDSVVEEKQIYINKSMVIEDRNLIKEDKDEEAIIDVPHEVNRKDIFTNCKTIIPLNYKIKSSSHRINAIIKELKSLNVDEFPNACGVLLRTLLELSAKIFLEERDGEDHTEDGFEAVVKSAANKLVAENRINKQLHSAIFSEIDTLRLLFNGYVHNVQSYPSSEALKSIFKAHIKFIEACLK